MLVAKSNPSEKDIILIYVLRVFSESAIFLRKVQKGYIMKTISKIILLICLIADVCGAGNRAAGAGEAPLATSRLKSALKGGRGAPMASRSVTWSKSIEEREVPREAEEAARAEESDILDKRLRGLADALAAPRATAEGAPGGDGEPDIEEDDPETSGGAGGPPPTTAPATPVKAAISGKAKRTLRPSTKSFFLGGGGGAGGAASAT